MELFRDGQSPTVIFCDGACSGNPGKGGWGAIVATPDGQVEEIGAYDPETTNNRMELMGSIRSLDKVRAVPGKVMLFTDSVYVIRGITQWIWGWRKRGWKNAEGADVANRDLWERLLPIVSARGQGNPVDWRFVRGHAGIPGNERVDEIAVAFTKGQRPQLYKGPLLGYGVPIHDVPDDTSLPEPKPKQAKAAAYSYVSVVDGVAKRHTNWPDCEKRVKGRSGARFKKAMSEADEQEILAGWGVSL